MGDGPNVTSQSVIDYLNNQLDDPVTQQFLDQLMAATDDAREQVGAAPDPMLTERARETLRAMWSLLIEWSERYQCEHLIDRPIQPTAIIPDEHRQLCRVCLDCAREWQLPKHYRNGSKYECPCCGDWHDITTDTVQMTVLQHWQFVALCLLCPDCERAISEREEPRKQHRIRPRPRRRP